MVSSRNRRFGGGGIRRGIRGPGSGPGTPMLLSTLPEAWFRGDTGVSATSWTSKEGNAYIADGTGHMPGVTTLGGKPAFSFDGATQYFTLPSALASAMTGTNYTSIVVCNVSSLTGSRYFLSFGQSGGFTNYMGNFNTNTAKLGVNHNDGTSETVQETSAVFGLGDHYGGVVYEDAADTLDFHADGVADGSGTITKNPASMDTGGIGALVRASAAGFWAGAIAETILYTSKLSATDLAKLWGYISTRYGL